MSKLKTAIATRFGLLSGEKLFQKRARVALPYLIRQAQAGQTIYYSDLAKELNIPNPRNLNYVLGTIGNALLHLGTASHTVIPPIQFIVINKRQGVPGEGVDGFGSLANFNKLNKNQKKEIIDRELTKIYTYQHWDWVLNELALEPMDLNLQEELSKAKSIRGGGESESHKKFKEFISKNPHVLGLKNTLKNVTVEYALPSGDTIDILFIDKNLKIGVEVKSDISNAADILRGIFQCVKYKCILEAEQVITNHLPNSQVILALQGNLPDELISVKNLLGVEVIDGIKMHGGS